MSSAAFGLAIAIFIFAFYTFLLARRSDQGTMGRNGPGIRIAETTKCEHTWAAAQAVASPIYRRMSLWLFGIGTLCLSIGAVNGIAGLVVGAVGGLGVQVFMLGAASVRARKAAAGVQCEHQVAEKSPRATPPHRKHKSGGRVTPKKTAPPRGRR